LAILKIIYQKYSVNFIKMKISSAILSLYFIFILILFSCVPDKRDLGTTRLPVDTIGFAHYDWQMDSIMARIERLYLFEEYHPCEDRSDDPAKLIISPHDDYTYVGPIYSAVIHQIKSPVVIMFGVAHKASQFGMENRIIFDSFDYWKGPYQNARVSELREEIIASLDDSLLFINDSIHSLEHSLEALLPFLQYFNKKVEIVPILVPYMSFERIDTISRSLAAAISKVAKEHRLEWGKDFAMIISNDAVHYGDEDWGGKNFAPFGADSAGYSQAINYEKTIISSTLCGPLNPDSIRKFCEFTVQSDNYKEYRWTWCGRYSVPLGLLTGYYLAGSGDKLICGTSSGYMTSIDHPSVPVDDLGMGFTAPANIHHWVGYVGIVYK
jgi:MEMO1 family protein